MTAQAHSTGPNTRRRDAYRLGVWCYTCHAPREFVYDASNGSRVWCCTECRGVELDSEGNIAPSPWVRRDAPHATVARE